MPTRNHEKALHELYMTFNALLHDTPAETAKNQLESLEFHTNRILVEFKANKTEEGDLHRNFAKGATGMVKAYKKFCLMEAKRGLKYKGTGDVTAASDTTAAAAAPPVAAAGGAPPPPPMGAMPVAEDPAPKKKKKAGGMDALFASIQNVKAKNGRTVGLKRVKDKDRSCKNRDLVKSSKVDVAAIEAKKKRNAAKKKKNAGAKAKKVLPPKNYYAAGQGTHYVENQPDGANIEIQITEPRQAVYIYKCGACVVTVKGKFKSLTLVNSKKTQVAFPDVISVVEVNNCTSVKLQSLGQCPSVCIDKTDGCQVWLSKSSLDCGFVCAKISEVNVSWPDPNSEDPENPEWVDKPIPEQYKHRIDTDKKLVTADVSDLYSEC